MWYLLGITSPIGHTDGEAELCGEQFDLVDQLEQLSTQPLSCGRRVQILVKKCQTRSGHIGGLERQVHGHLHFANCLGSPHFSQPFCCAIQRVNTMVNTSPSLMAFRSISSWSWDFGSHCGCRMPVILIL